MPPLSGEQKRRVKKIWNKLGDDEWKEVIDGEHHHLGPMVFDECLHRENWGIPEKGYLASMLKGKRYLEQQLGKKTTMEMWLRTHKLCTQHFLSRRRTGTDGHNIGGKIRTRKRQPVGGLFGQKGLVSNQAKREISQRKPRIARLVHVKYRPKGADSDDSASWNKPSRESSRFSLSASSIIVDDSENEGYKLVFLAMKRKKRKAVFDHYCDKFYRNMRHAKTDEQKLTAIAEFHIIMQQMHIARDGTQRVSGLFLNKHLTEFGFHPILQMKPHRADVSSTPEFLVLLKEGLQLWEDALREYKAKQQAAAAARTKKQKRRILADSSTTSYSSYTDYSTLTSATTATTATTTATTGFGGGFRNAWARLWGRGRRRSRREEQSATTAADTALTGATTGVANMDGLADGYLAASPSVKKKKKNKKKHGHTRTIIREVPVPVPVNNARGSFIATPPPPATFVVAPPTPLFVRRSVVRVADSTSGTATDTDTDTTAF